MVTLYLFTTFGTFTWDEYPSHEACLDTKVELTAWFDSVSPNNQDLYSIDCIALESIEAANENF